MMKTDDMGSRLKKQRIAKNFTLDKLAQMSGVSKAMLSQIEKNKVNPTVAILIKVTDAMNIGIGELINTDAQKSILFLIVFMGLISLIFLCKNDGRAGFRPRHSPPQVAGIRAGTEPRPTVTIFTDRCNLPGMVFI